VPNTTKAPATLSPGALRRLAGGAPPKVRAWLRRLAADPEAAPDARPVSRRPLGRQRVPQAAH
jgi:hypothetical protein